MKDINKQEKDYFKKILYLIALLMDISVTLSFLAIAWAIAGFNLIMASALSLLGVVLFFSFKRMIDKSYDSVKED